METLKRSAVLGIKRGGSNEQGAGDCQGSGNSSACIRAWTHHLARGLYNTESDLATERDSGRWRVTVGSSPVTCTLVGTLILREAVHMRVWGDRQGKFLHWAISFAPNPKAALRIFFFIKKKKKRNDKPKIKKLPCGGGEKWWCGYKLRTSRILVSSSVEW